MGRTIPSFRIAAVLEEKIWKQYRKFLNNKNDRKVFDNMFSTAMLYSSACSYSIIPIRIHPIMMSIVFHHYKILNERLVDSKKNMFFSKENDNNVNQNNSLILKRELDKWKTYSDILRKQNRDLFNQMLQSSSYKYLGSIEAKGEQYATESLLMSLIFEQYKLINNKTEQSLSKFISYFNSE
jgi:hypothetical protein